MVVTRSLVTEPSCSPSSVGRPPLEGALGSTQHGTIFTSTLCTAHQWRRRRVLPGSGYGMSRDMCD